MDDYFTRNNRVARVRSSLYGHSITADSCSPAMEVDSLKRFQYGFAIAILATTLGCGSDNGPTGPEPVTLEEVLGTYRAELFTVTVDGEVTDILEIGGELTVSLDASGGTAGRIVLPLGEEPIDADLDGIFFFDVIAHTIAFEHEADTPIRDMEFAAVRTETGIELRSEETFGGGTVTIVLAKV